MTDTVLVVDDEEEILTLLEIELSSQGYLVLKANNGRDALIKAKEFQPSLVILDVLMPDLDGGQVLKQLKAHALTKNIPVVFLTPVLTREEELMKQIGVTVDSIAYPAIAKPFNVRVLLDEVDKLMHTRKKTV
jgi:two-component system, OmpR family, alkaline phosphatase synthesis response regulator PhoP